MGVKESWERIAAWAAANMPAKEFVAAAGATDQQIAELEAAIGLELPPDVRESYRVHDGTRGWSFPEGTDVLSLGGIRGLYESQRHVQSRLRPGSYEMLAKVFDGPIKPERWSAKRIPVADDGGGGGFQIDLDPAEGGTIGQVIWYDREYGPRRVLAPSWAAFMERIVADCAAGVYFYDEEEEQPWARRDEEEDEDSE